MDERMRNGQFSIEFVMIIAVSVVIGGLFLASAGRVLLDTSEQQRVAAINDVAYMIQDEIILATTVQDGYTRRFVIPTKADRFEYSLASSESTITLTSGSTTITYDIPSITGTLHKGSNTITKQGSLQVT